MKSDSLMNTKFEIKDVKHAKGRRERKRIQVEELKRKRKRERERNENCTSRNEN